ncbi:hypothetical protein M153_17670001034 [Pseudoloma neurophilia]|uniref:Uncharacterized protein n=1 Tax=Pseudoloma neurophilia TaxID=146866 RepID=A0A0R0M1W7_9MICR|nr:hypothetical protein M153_17670001034 [Pseudoloma neurophilia]
MDPPSNNTTYFTANENMFTSSKSGTNESFVQTENDLKSRLDPCLGEEQFLQTGSVEGHVSRTISTHFFAYQRTLSNLIVKLSVILIAFALLLMIFYMVRKCL